jgi:hypothetical protein
MTYSKPHLGLGGRNGYNRFVSRLLFLPSAFSYVTGS